MKNKTYLFLFAILFVNVLLGQTSVSKEINNVAGKKIQMSFNRASVKVIGWNQDKLAIKGTVSINNGEYDEHFTIDIKEQSDQVSLRTFVKDIDELPKITVIEVNGEKHYFKDNNEGRKALKAFKKSEGEDVNHWSEGVHTEINLEIYVPQATVLELESLYGDVDLEKLNGAMDVENTYGHVNALLDGGVPRNSMKLHSTYSFVDVTVPASAKMNLKLNSGYGEIYTDMNIEQDESKGERRNFGSKVNGRINGGGTPLEIEATYSNIYLRKL
ncbi:MAG: DUF4097 family beta strand repeat-containing protein [Bacteroidota bacterium]